MMKDKDFCDGCKFKDDCVSDWAAKFRRRAGASLVNVIVFMAASLMIMAHVFFFANLSSESRVIQAETLQKRFRYDRALNDAISAISEDKFGTVSEKIKTYDDFKGKLALSTKYDSEDLYMRIYDLSYDITDFDTGAYKTAVNKVDTNDTTTNAKAIVPVRAFPPMIPESGDNRRYFLVRVYGTDKTYGEREKAGGKRELMYQVLVRHDPDKHGPERARVLSFQEVWY